MAIALTAVNTKSENFYIHLMITEQLNDFILAVVEE